MTKFLVKIGFDNGGAESGPIVHTATEIVEAVDAHDAERKINNKYGYGRDSAYCGCSINELTPEKLSQIEEEQKLADEMYQSAIESGALVVDDMDEYWKEVEKLEQTKDKLIEAVDEYFSTIMSKLKWKINVDDKIVEDLKDKSEDYIKEYLLGLIKEVV